MIKSHSDWFRIDLHLHTDWSKKTKENDYTGVFSVETLKEKLNESDVKIFSLTDHNIINIDAYREYYENYDPESDPLLLVGVELDIVVELDEPKTYHTLIVFNFSTVEKAQYVHDKLEVKYSELKSAIKERTLTIDHVISLFPDDDFFFIPHAGNRKGIISPYRENLSDAQCMIILMQSAMEKVNEQKRHHYNIGFNDVLTKAFQNKEDHAYIEFSDNHCIQSYPYSSSGQDAVEHSFYYVKGGQSFETLRQAFIDPQSRIKSSADHAKIKTSPRYLQSIKIMGLEWFVDNEITFSPHLNVVIGGRSSGKSLLMYLLGCKIDSTSGKAVGYEVDLEKVKIKAVQNAQYCDETSILNEKITYIRQGEIVDYFESKNLQELTKSTGTDTLYKEAKSAFLDHKQALETTVGELVTAYQNGDSFATQTFVLHSSTIDHILGDSFTFCWEEAEVRDRFNLFGLIQEASDIVDELARNIDRFRECKLLTFNEAELDAIEVFSSLVNNKAEVLKKKDEKNCAISHFFNLVSELISERNGQLNNEAQLKDESRQTLRDLKSKISSDFAHLIALKKASIKFSNFDYRLKKMVKIHDDIDLVLESKCDGEESLDDLFLDGIKQSNTTLSIYRNLLNLLQGKASLKNHGDVSSESLKKKTNKQLELIFNSFNNPIDYLKYSDGETSIEKSPGYNSEKYLEIILGNKGTELVFIDQPEDNLGNTFITTTLVEMIRKIKFTKQIFLVTHNPSLVVHGDSENVIIASNDENRISYRQIVIENESAQKEICQILDGGEYIFHKRSRKYNIQRIMKGRGHE